MSNIFNRLKTSKVPLLYLAPMENYSDLSFRFLCKEYGADILTTEFISSDDLDKNIERSFKKFTILEEERPIGIQLYGHRKEAMITAAKIVEQANPDFIDINWGCPVKKIANRGAGSGMLRYPDKLIEITEAIVKAVNIPVTVKTRLGWDENSIIIQDLALRLQDTGIQALAIHGRTRQQLYKGIANWSEIKKIKENPSVNIPIIGNGDIDSPKDAFEKWKQTNVDALMIGRAAIGKPWIFEQIKTYLTKGILLPDPNLNQRVDIAIKHLKQSLEWKGQTRGINEMRRHYIRYFNEFEEFIKFRKLLLTENNPKNIIELLNNFKN